MEDKKKVLVVMRGLPFCGKSYTAKKLLEEATEGVIYSTDEFFYTQLKPDCPDEYSFSPRFLGAAHKWNLLRAQKSIENQCPLVIVDNTNTTASEPRAYVEYALNQGYEVRIQEPTSPRWLEIASLLLDKRGNKADLKDWAKKLEEGSKETHSVPAWAIERMMWRWATNLTVEQILDAPSM